MIVPRVLDLNWPKLRCLRLADEDHAEDWDERHHGTLSELRRRCRDARLSVEDIHTEPSLVDWVDRE